MGRKAKPTTLKVLAGNPGKRKLNKQEPKFEKEDIADIPDELQGAGNEQALKEWKRVTPLLLEAGVLTKIDRTAIIAYCKTYQRWLDAEDKIKVNGFVECGEKGCIYQSPYVSIANTALTQLRALMGEFGMTPSTRVKLITPKKEEGNPLEEFLKRASKRHS